MKSKSTRERGEAALRVKTAGRRLEELKDQLKRRQKRAGPDPRYVQAMYDKFWQEVGMDRRIARGKL